MIFPKLEKIQKNDFILLKNKKIHFIFAINYYNNLD